MDQATPTILFAGGGTGGHIFPNMAIVERLRAMGVAFDAHFLVSQRPLDGEILKQASIASTSLVVRPWSSKPMRWPAFTRAWFAAKRQVRALAAEHEVAAVVATGGFVSGPAIVAAQQLKLPVVLVNLDAVPGKANRRMARHATALFSAYATPHLPTAETVGMPLRAVAIGPNDRAEARRRLGLDPQRHTLMITGGSQGAQSVNRMVIELVRRSDVREALQGWQVLHVCGPNNEEETRRGYAEAKLDATVSAFCDQMGAAWRAASVAISRAGAGSVAEAWANGAPTLFFPYPMHKDEHQRLNAQPMVDAGGAVLFRDVVDPAANAQRVAPQLVELLRDKSHRASMRDKLHATRPPDGAQRVADWLAQQVHG